MVNLVGGYDSTGFWILAISLLVIGAILNIFSNIIVRWIGFSSFICGGLFLSGELNFVIANSPNLPSYAGYTPLLFVIVIILTAFRMLSSPTRKRKSKITHG